MREICKSSSRTTSINVAPAKSGTSAFTKCESTFNGVNSADRPRIRAMFSILEPTTLGSIGLNLQWKIQGIDLNLGVAVPFTDVSENFEQTTYFSVRSSFSF